MQAAGRLPRFRKLSRSIAEVLSATRTPERRRSGSVGPALLSASGGVLVGAALAVTPAANAQDDVVLEEVTVTGSRIPRRDFTANAPITTVDETIFDETGSIGVETILNQLPQFTPAVTQFASFDTENTATNTVGASTISLRGLGPNRNLVLINGRRAMPVNPTMVVDTNTIPASAVSRVEIISGGASAVYGADAVGGVVNFILKDDFEGASVDVRFGDTQHGGNQEVTISGLIGANLGDGRGNVMVGVERATRSEQFLWERDWRVEDAANPSIGGTQVFPTETWFSEAPGSSGNFPSQAVVNAIFDQAAPGAVRNRARFYVNRTPDGTGTVFTGLNHGANDVAGSYRYEGPLNVDNYGQFQGLPFRVMQPDGGIKENTWYQPASIPLERLSSFASGHFEVSDNVRVTGQAMFTRTDNRTRWGATSDTIGVWGAVVPFGTNIYEPSVASFGADGLPNTGDAGEDMTTLPAFLPGGTHQLNCPAVGGCTETQAWPVPPEVEALMMSRPFPERDIRVNRTQDDLRYQLGDARGSDNYTSSMQISLGVEGELSSGDSWDVTLSTGRTDAQNTLTGNIRLTTYRQLMATPNYGVGFVGDPNPFSTGFAEGIPTCTSGMPIVRNFNMSEDCIEMLHAPLQNQTNVDQQILEANLIGDLIDMPAGPLGYAVGLAHRENSYRYIPDNLIRNGSTADAIAGTFPNTISGGKFDVSEIYGELLIPIVADGPAGIQSFTVELGGRVSDWSIPQVEQVTTYKALVDWTIAPRYRLRGGFNRAMRAPNLGELFLGRSQAFNAQPVLYGDQCSQNSRVGPYSGNPAVSGEAQAARTVEICRALMGSTGAFEYYDNRPITDQLTNTGFFVSAGTQNSFGNPNVREEQADTFTLGVVMDFLDDWSLTVDYYTIEIEDMIALESPDTVFERCLSLELNPAGDPTTPACMQIVRNQFTGNRANIDLTFTNQGKATVSGVDFQLNGTKMLGDGGLNVNIVANYNLESTTQDRPGLSELDWAGTRGCALQIQCQQYDYRIFSSVSYFRGPWSLTLRHQFWPSLLDASYAEGVTGPVNPLGTIDESYQLFYVGGSYTFGENYTLTVGIENLFDENPPRVGGDPNNSRFPIPPSHMVVVGNANFGAGGSPVYEPLGRRAYVTLSMNF